MCEIFLTPWKVGGKDNMFHFSNVQFFLCGFWDVDELQIFCWYLPILINDSTSNTIEGTSKTTHNKLLDYAGWLYVV